MEQSKLDIKGVARIVEADQLEEAVAEGWAVASSYVEEEAFDDYAEIPNPEFRFTDDVGYCDNGKPATVTVRSGTIVRKTQKFVLSMDKESAAGQLALENKLLKGQVLESSLKSQENEKILNRDIAQLRHEIGEKDSVIADLDRSYKKALSERDLARGQVDTLKDHISRFRECLVVVWSEVGNERMRKILGSKFPAELEDQTIPAQMAKTFFDHLLEDEGGS